MLVDLGWQCEIWGDENDKGGLCLTCLSKYYFPERVADIPIGDDPSSQPASHHTNPPDPQTTRKRSQTSRSLLKPFHPTQSYTSIYSLTTFNALRFPMPFLPPAYVVLPITPCCPSPAVNTNRSCLSPCQIPGACTLDVTTTFSSAGAMSCNISLSPLGNKHQQSPSAACTVRILCNESVVKSTKRSCFVILGAWSSVVSSCAVLLSLPYHPTSVSGARYAPVFRTCTSISAPSVASWAFKSWTRGGGCWVLMSMPGGGVCARMVPRSKAWGCSVCTDTPV